MRFRNPLLPLVAATLLAGCTFPSPPRSSYTPLVSPIAPAAGSLTAIKHKTVGVLYSADAASDLDYLRRYHQHAVSSIEGRLLIREIRQGYANSSLPDRTLAAMEDSLSRHLQHVTFYKDQAALDRDNPDVIVILDTHHVLLTPRTSDVRVDYMADFFDRDYRFLGRAEGHQANSMPALWTHNQRTEQIVSELDRQQALQIEAMNEFDNSISWLFQ